MAAISGQLKDASINGKPRDLMDVIFNIAPTDTPFLSMCGRADASQTLHKWQTETLAAPAANSHYEGADVSTFSEVTSTELANKTQILQKAVNVSGTAQAVKQAGVAKQYAHQMALRSKELKKDVEFALLSNQLATAETAGSVTRKMAGLPCWMWDNYDLSSGGTAPVYGSSAAVAGSNRPVTEAMCTSLMTDIYEAGGNPDRIMVSPKVRVLLSKILHGGATRMEAVEDKKAYSTIDVWVSDFGTLKIVPNRVQAGVTYSKYAAFFLDPEYWKVAYLRGFTEEKLAHTGDSLKGHILVECTLQASQPASSGMIGDISDSDADYA
jgi:hypothetical protein